ncbi:serine/threonine-protein kinase [Streptomyces sp. NPDC048275]|uniref:serine/threonine-protein kinase n=1 Tax=Streptomyces sp. NPDC048275 TaxID=3155629 RepID=UPI0033FBFE0B
MTGVDEAVGRVIAGRYRLLRRLGAGGMGRVWLAYDQELACEAALKEIALPPGVSDREVSARIARARGEARHAARLREHPHVATVHDIVEDGGLPWIVMAFLPGATDLEAVVRERGPLPPAEVARIGLAVLDALLEGHRLGVLHRDVKPANVLLTSPDSRPRYRTEGGQVLLTDYGISLELSSGEPRLTATSEILGTPRFMAPERARGEPPTPASDLFALGCTLYFALEGTGPFDRDSDYATMTALLFEGPARPHGVTDLTPVLLGLLAKDPGDRMDAEEAARRLTELTTAPRPGPPAQEEPTAFSLEPPSEVPPVSARETPAEEPTAVQLEPPPQPTPEPEELGPSPGPLPHEGGAARLRPGLSRLRRRRAWLVVGVVLVALAAAGGIYLAQFRPPSPEPTTALPTAPTSVSSIPVGSRPWGVAVLPDGRRAYVANFDSGSVSVIDTAANRTVGSPISVGKQPLGVAVSPDGRRAYVANSASDSVSVIDTAANRTVGSPIPVGSGPLGVEVSPDGRRAYVTNSGSDSVSVIDTATNRTVGSPISVGKNPAGVAVLPDGRRAYVTNIGSDSVSVIDTATSRTVGSPISVGKKPDVVAVSPDGRRAYVANITSDSVSVIDTATNRTVGSPIPIDKGPEGVAVSPDGRWVYVANNFSASVSVIDTAENRTVGRPIPVGKEPLWVALSPDGRRAYVTNGASNSVSVITF